MITKTLVTTRQLPVDIEQTLKELRAIQPEWNYINTIGNTVLFRLCIMNDER